ncbi:FMN-binding negative transcriptional regulator [Sulfitobacter sp. S0837]|uniref:FMN-binding negative transcriptional regulator n=1 Tax=Sulfitobacter maritimus TaxID=2741719 RepID=UPI001582D86E|nr:FMN-binding negative transcriptional regulator [Sulfitobacter maritimus]NUH67060.1 FMN-binding negative transcriptional regulator [Sulfitobacter maritimus]
MHPNPIFRKEGRDRNLGFARDVGFGVLAMNAEEGPLMAHVPFILNEAGDLAELHLVRSNPIARALRTPQSVRLAVTGADSYVSPDWYGIEDQVPTWNYVAVHLTGLLEMRPAEALPDLLARQSAIYEARLAPKTPWKMDKMSPEARDKMLRMIVPCQIRVTGIDGTWKLGQNKADAVRLAAADQMSAHGFGTDPALMADLMRGV